MTNRYVPIGLVICGVLATDCGSTPTAPGDRYGSPGILLRCDSAGSGSALSCTAPVFCSLYPCRPGVPSDVTATARWTTDDVSIARVTGPGVITSVGLGNTVVRASIAGVSEGFRPVAVFAGTPPLPTFGLQGVVYAGATPNDGKIDGATIEVIDGFIAGRTAISGARPDLIAGFGPGPPPRPGLFIINGVPPGTVRIRVSKEGYLPVERDVTFTFAGGFDVNVQLRQ